MQKSQNTLDLIIDTTMKAKHDTVQQFRKQTIAYLYMLRQHLLTESKKITPSDIDIQKDNQINQLKQQNDKLAFKIKHHICNIDERCD